MKIKRILPEERRASLRKMLSQEKRCLRFLEAHNGISALIASNSSAKSTDGKSHTFDGIWISGLTESAERGMPDIELHGLNSRIALVREISHVSFSPIIVDGDTGGTREQLVYNCLNLEEIGASALIIEDKVFPKNNSLDESKSQDLADPKVFADKIKFAKKSLLSREFMLIARLESLIAGESIQDAIDRAKRYIDAGADGIVIHSRKKTPEEIIEFSEKYNNLKHTVPLVAIPTTYNNITEAELYSKNFRITIYANHMLRAAYKAMATTAQLILKNQRAFETDSICEPVSTLLNLPIPGNYDLRE